MPKKVFWVCLMIAVVLWIGVGIYYLKTNAQIKENKRRELIDLVPSVMPTLSPIFNPTERSLPWEKYHPLEWTSTPFASWEKIEDSQDRFLIMADGDFAPQADRLVPKVRIAFREKVTVLVAEKNGKTEWAKYFSDFTEEEINNLIIPGEYIKIFFKLTEDKQGNVKDKNGNFLAEKIVKRLRD